MYVYNYIYVCVCDHMCIYLFISDKCHFNGIRSIFELEPVIFHGARTVGTWELASLQGSGGVGLGLV